MPRTLNVSEASSYSTPDGPYLVVIKPTADGDGSDWESLSRLAERDADISVRDLHVNPAVASLLRESRPCLMSLPALSPTNERIALLVQVMRVLPGRR